MSGSPFDELRFGSAKTLDLHVASPTAEEGVRRTELWLRNKQMEGAGEVLVITGRGARSVDGVAVLRPAIERLFTKMKRLGVITQAMPHTEGSFAVTLAPVKSLFEAPKRYRRRYTPPGIPFDGAGFSGLSPETRAALRHLAQRSLESLGAPVETKLVEDEMHRQLSLLVPGLPSDEDPDLALRRIAIEAADSYDD